VWKPMVVGALPLAAICAILFYGLTYNLIGGYRTSRRDRRRAAPVSHVHVDLGPVVPLSLDPYGAADEPAVRRAA
jgi:hypothetical protein